MSARPKLGHLQVRRIVDVPLREVSGICLRRCRRRKLSLIAVGDRASTLAWTPLPRTDRARKGAPLEWFTIDLGDLPGSSLPAKNAQIEAVCADGEGRVVLLQESPPRAELVDLDASRVVASIELVIQGRSELARSWNDPGGSRGEGAVLLPGGHLLLAKEKRPAALIEFGPRGARSRGLPRRAPSSDGAAWPVGKGRHRFVALAVWQPDETLRECCEDFSDLEIGPDGRLYVLSDESATIARLGPLAPGGGTAAHSAAWHLDDLGAKPEGLAFVADGRAIVALDKRKRRNNLLLLEPAIATS